LPGRLVGVVGAVAIVICVAGCTTRPAGSFDDNPASAPPTTAGGPFDPSTLKPSDPRSLLVRSNYRRAFAIAERLLGARAAIEDAEIYPGQLALTVLENGKQISFAVQYDGDYGSKSGGPLSGTPQTFHLAALAGDTPAKLVSRIAVATDKPASLIQYVILSPNPSAPGIYWQLYTANTSDYYAATGADGPIDAYAGTNESTIH
jgi:hypothetical protein